MKITDQMSVEAYRFASAVHRGTIEKRLAAEQLSLKTGMNSKSADGYIRNLLHMLSGKVYHRTLNYYATRHFLDGIRADFGDAALSNALSALRQHLDYYDSTRHGRQVKLRTLLQAYLDSLHSDESHPEEIGFDDTLIEGAKKRVTVNAFERNPRARRLCVARYGYRCCVCEFDFAKVYGKIGREFIHVHHLVELSTVGSEYRIVPVRDLRPVCPNCHAMLHKQKPAFTIEELRGRLKKPQR